MAYLEHDMPTHTHTHTTPVTTKWDRGRRLLSVTKLAAGGAILAMSVVGLILGFAGVRTSNFADAVVAMVGGTITFVFLLRTFHIYGRTKD
jgi:hypothetical protein